MQCKECLLSYRSMPVKQFEHFIYFLNQKLTIFPLNRQKCTSSILSKKLFRKVFTVQKLPLKKDLFKEGDAIN